MRRTIAALLSTFVLLGTLPATAQPDSQLTYSQDDLQFLAWIEQQLAEQNVNPEIMPSDVKILAAQDYCSRLDEGETVAQLRAIATDRASQVDNPESRRLMTVLLDTILSGGLTYYCPEYLSQTDYA